MKNKTLNYDLYTLYDRVLDGCTATVEVEYSIEEAVKSKNLQDIKCNVLNVSFSSEVLKFLKKVRFNYKQIQKDVKNALKDTATILELLGEELSDEEWKALTQKPENNFCKTSIVKTYL